MTTKRRAASRGGFNRAVKRARVVVELEPGTLGGETVAAELSVDLDWLSGASLNDVGATISSLRDAARTEPPPKRAAAELRRVDAPHLDPIRLRDKNVVGRSRLCDVPIPSAKVSRKHFSLRLVDDAYVIEDLNSANRTWLNGEVLERPRSLANGDVISVGDVTFQFAELR